MSVNERLTKIEKQLMEISNGINSHVGSIGIDVHDLADDNVAGFLSPDMAKLLRQRKRRRTWVNDTDIMTLECGYYTGTNFINAPVENATWQCDVDVYYGYEGRKNIRFYENVSNRLYYTTVTSNAIGNTFSWQLITTKKVLYKTSSTTGNISGSIIHLSESLTEYGELEFMVHNNYNNIPFYFKTNRTYGSGSQTHFYADNNLNGDMSEMSVQIIDGNKVKIVNNIFHKTENLSITETINDSLAIVKITAIKDWR